MIPIGAHVEDIIGIADLRGTVVGSWNGLVEVRCDREFLNSCGDRITGWVASERQLKVIEGEAR